VKVFCIYLLRHGWNGAAAFFLQRKRPAIQRAHWFKHREYGGFSGPYRYANATCNAESASYQSTG